MNIGIMQLTVPTKSANLVTSSSAKTVSTSQLEGVKNNNFGDIFQKAVLSTAEDMGTLEEVTEGVDLQKIAELLNSQSPNEVMDLLGISHDEGLLMVQVGEDGKAVAMDELMNLDDLLAVLNIDVNELLEMMQQVKGNDMTDTNNLWELIDTVVEEGPVLIQQLIAAFQGDHQVTSKQAEKLLELLKLSEVVGRHSDLLGVQSTKITQLTEFLKLFNEQIKELANKQTTTQPFMTQRTETTVANKVSIEGFEQVVKQVTKNTQLHETAQSSISTVTTSTNTTKTFNIQLPVEKGAQSEALAKEIQNLINRSQFSHSQGTMKLLLKLYPENLGSIRIELMQQDGVLSARLLTSTAVGKELLDSQLQQLKTAFAQQNIQMDRIDIAQSLQETDRNSRDQNQFDNLFKQQQSEQDDTDQDEQDDQDKKSFQDYLINEEV
ncbi:flagellar hook-length control protein FliK [Lysinibacillus halotolerans]